MGSNGPGREHNLRKGTRAQMFWEQPDVLCGWSAVKRFERGEVREAVGLDTIMAHWPLEGLKAFALGEIGSPYME